MAPAYVISGDVTVQVVEPKVRAYLYTWGEGRMTAEGEFIPVRVESLDVGYIDGMMCGSSFCLWPLAHGLPCSVPELHAGNSAKTSQDSP